MGKKSNKKDKKDDATVINVREFKVEEIPESCTWIVVGPPGSGKTTFIENLVYFNRHRYPTARIFMGTPSGYKQFCSIFHPLYVSSVYDEEQEKTHIARQNKCNLENGKEYPGNYAVNILDDVSDDTKIYKTKTMAGLFKNGSQHWNQLFILGSQYAIDMPPGVRKAVSYIAIFREPEANERRKLYDNFGGITGSYKDFCDLMDQLTGDYTCMIIVKRTQSNDREDAVFWYKTKVLKPWKFGSQEYRDWGEKRYNKDYREKVEY